MNPKPWPQNYRPQGSPVAAPGTGSRASERGSGLPDYYEYDGDDDDGDGDESLDSLVWLLMAFISIIVTLVVYFNLILTVFIAN